MNAATPVWGVDFTGLALLSPVPFNPTTLGTGGSLPRYAFIRLVPCRSGFLNGDIASVYQSEMAQSQIRMMQDPSGVAPRGSAVRHYITPTKNRDVGPDWNADGQCTCSDCASRRFNHPSPAGWSAIQTSDVPPRFYIKVEDVWDVPIDLKPRKTKFRVNNDSRPDTDDEYADFRRWCRPDVLNDNSWICGHAETFRREDWVFISLPEMPATPQSEPPPILWDKNVNPRETDIGVLFPKEYYARGESRPNELPIYRYAHIPNLRKKTAAKTDEGRLRFKLKMETAWASRKKLCAEWLRIVPYNPTHSDSLDGGNERVLRCAKCGGSYFDKKITCKDCGFSMRWIEKMSPPEEQVSDNELRKLTVKLQRTKQRRRVVLAMETFLRILASQKGGLERLDNPDELRKAAATARILTDQMGLLSRDVAAENGESAATLDKRCERIVSRMEKIASENEALPKLTVEITERMLLACRYNEEFQRLCPRFKGDFMALGKALLDDLLGEEEPSPSQSDNEDSNEVSGQNT